VGAIVALVLEVDRAQVENAGDEHDPVEVEAVPLLQELGQGRGAQRAV